MGRRQPRPIFNGELVKLKYGKGQCPIFAESRGTERGFVTRGNRGEPGRLLGRRARGVQGRQGRVAAHPAYQGPPWAGPSRGAMRWLPPPPPPSPPGPPPPGRSKDTRERSRRTRASGRTPASPARTSRSRGEGPGALLQEQDCTRKKNAGKLARTGRRGCVQAKGTIYLHRFIWWISQTRGKYRVKDAASWQAFSQSAGDWEVDHQGGKWELNHRARLTLKAKAPNRAGNRAGQ